MQRYAREFQRVPSLENSNRPTLRHQKELRKVVSNLEGREKVLLSYTQSSQTETPRSDEDQYGIATLQQAYETYVRLINEQDALL